MTTTALLSQVKARLAADDAGHWTMDDSEIARLLAIVEVMHAALEEIKSGGGRAEILGLKLKRCPQCASAEMADEALRAVDKLASDEGAK